MKALIPNSSSQLRSKEPPPPERKMSEEGRAPSLDLFKLLMVSSAPIHKSCVSHTAVGFLRHSSLCHCCKTVFSILRCRDQDLRLRPLSRQRVACCKIEGQLAKCACSPSAVLIAAYIVFMASLLFCPFPGSQIWVRMYR